MWSCHSAMSPARQTCWRGPRRAPFTSHHTGYRPGSHTYLTNTTLLLRLSSVESWQYIFVHPVVTYYFVFSLIHWLSWCLCPVTPRIAWDQPCSPIIWWKAAALSSQSLQPTTLKGQCLLRLVVGGFLSVLLTTNDLICSILCLVEFGLRKNVQSSLILKHVTQLFPSET